MLAFHCFSDEAADKSQNEEQSCAPDGRPKPSEHSHVLPVPQQKGSNSCLGYASAEDFLGSDI
jgi:hypothetical protein